ncbi:reverse transcriptase domain-containing protein [Tanacetum coccineum]|uniref:Reverse transcriptase domain-containing protein n=1 Tax=Tanacetum coccineum TaxID=301880 RepID=A0ABQ4Z759_9ASTR
MKQSIAELPMLAAPTEKEELIMYLAAAKEAVSAVLMTEREGKQVPIYFVSRALQGPEINYTSMEKLILALVSASKRLKRYFQAHTVVVITDQPIKQLLSNPEVTGRLLKWRFELEEHDIQYRPRTSVKGVNHADFIVERPEDDVSDTPMEEREELPDPWVLFTDGSSCIDGSGAGLIITNPEGMEFTYALRFRFNATNNEAEYEALIAGLRIARQMGVQNLQANVDSKLVANQQVLVEELREKSIDEQEILAVVEEEGHTWMTSVHEYLTEGILPEEKKKARAIRRKAGRFGLPGEIVSDNGKQFRDNPFKDWCEKLSIRQCFASVKHPQTNGLVERANRSLGEGIKARLVIPVEIGMPTLRTAEVDMIKNNEDLGINLDLLEEKREQAAIQEARSKAKMEKYYNAKVRSTSFRPGDFVYRNNEASHAEDGGKLGPKWEGPYEVTKALGRGAYKLRDRNGNTLPRTWNVCNLKKCYIHGM